MEKKNFIRKKEDFVCEHCGHQISGTGYTNHCPKCLWSKHVDNTPGDRRNPCGGPMEPISWELKQGLPKRVLHRCQTCGATRNNNLDDNDNWQSLVDKPLS
ncbi:MAG: RNHCP domain-containing protein [bacterium]